MSSEHSRLGRSERQATKVVLGGEHYWWLPADDDMAWNGEGWYFFRDGLGVWQETDANAIADLETALRGPCDA